MDDVARDVNEGRRRREVIKEVLTGGKSTPDATTTSFNNTASALKPKKGLAVGVSASVKLVKGMKHAVKAREGADGNEEKKQVERMETELKRCEVFIRQFARETVDWTHKMKNVMTSLYAWADAFGQVIGMSPESASEAFDAFKMVLKAQIIPVCNSLEAVVKERLLPQLSLLVDSMTDPLRLLEAMHTLEPLHYGLLNLDVSKSRPPPSLLEASQSYVALRGQLFMELPQYLKLLHRGITATIVQLNAWQTTFYEDAHIHWGGLWEALRVEEDSSISSAPETMQIWWERFSILEEALGELGILKRQKISPPSPAIGITRTPTTGSNGNGRPTADVVPMPSSATSSNYPVQVVETPPPAQYVQYVQYPHHVQLQSPPYSYPRPKQQVTNEPHSSPQPTHGRRRSGSVPVKVMVQALEPDRPSSPARIVQTTSRDAHDGRKERKERKRLGRPPDVTVPHMEFSQSYPRQSNNHSNPPPYGAPHNPQNNHPSRPPPLPHSHTQPIPSSNIPTRRPTQRSRSQSRATMEDFQYLSAWIGDTPLTAAQAYAVASSVLDSNTTGFTRRASPKRGDAEPSNGATDNRVSRGSRGSQHLTVPSNVEDSPFVSEVVVLDTESLAEKEREARPKVQRRGSVKKKFTDTIENVVRRSPSLHSLKRFSGPPRLGSPAPSPGLPQSSLQQQAHGRSHSRSRSRPGTPHIPSHPAHPTSPPLIINNSSNSSHSQGPYSTPVLYMCRVVSTFRLGRDVVYQGLEFHTLDVGMILWIVQELGHPSTHPSLPVHVDDGEDCLLLAMDASANVGLAFASFLVPVD